MFGFRALGRTHVCHRKNTAKMAGVRMPIPAEVLLPTAQHIGAPAVVSVKVGDEVLVGQKIAEADGKLSSPVYASVSGKVTKIEDYLTPQGRKVSAIRIASDGNMTEAAFTPVRVDTLEDLIAAARESGVVGLGGAGFPTAVKLEAIGKGVIDTVVFNGAECEPYITSDTRTMIDNIEEITEGVALLRRFLPEAEFIFGVEENKQECIGLLCEAYLADDRVNITPLPTLYPQGAEKVLIYNTTRRIVPEGGLPSDVGVLVLNVSTLACLAAYVKTGRPLVERTVTVDGSAIREPKNVIAPIGTSIGELIDFVGVSEDIGKVLYGGLMMGVPASNLSEPTIKTTGAVTVLTEADAKPPVSTPCIHCGRCVEACPLSLNPVAYSKALNIESKEERMARLEATKVNLCMECGCCSYVCPAKRPLVQNNRLGKAALREYQLHAKTLK